MRRTLVIIIFTLFTREATSQFKLTKLAEKLAPGDAPSAGVAINAKNPLNLVASPIAGKARFSVDGGATWQFSNLLPSATESLVLADGKGDFYILQFATATMEGTRILCLVSKDGGKTWLENGFIRTAPSRTVNTLRATVDEKQNLYVTWTEFNAPANEAACTSSIQFARSSNGKKWSVPVQLSQTPGNCKGDDDTPMGAYPAVSYDGKIICTWSQQARLFLDRSFDGGGFWLSNDIGVTSQPGGWDFTIPGLNKSGGLVSLMADRSKSQYGGSIYLTWDDQRNGNDDTDIWFIRSNNYGDNWTSPLRINDDEPGSHQYSPSLAMDQVTGLMYIAYFDRRAYEDNQTDVYVAYSMDGGSSFTNVKVTEAGFTPDGNAKSAVQVVANKGIVSIHWLQSDGSTSSSWATVLKHDDLAKAAEAKAKP